MKWFKKTQWFKKSQQMVQPQQSLKLPPIPSGCFRLTHFTDQGTAEKILSSGFRFGRQGLDSTADAFSNQSEILSLIQTGNTGAFNRSYFGSAVVLIDLTSEEHKMLNSISYYEIKNDTIPAFRILGYVYQNQLKTNPLYNLSTPLQITPLKGPAKFAPQNNMGVNPVPIPSPTETNQNTQDTW